MAVAGAALRRAAARAWPSCTATWRRHAPRPSAKPPPTRPSPRRASPSAFFFAGLTLEQREVLLLHFKPRTARQGNGFPRGRRGRRRLFHRARGGRGLGGGTADCWGGRGFGEMALISGQPARPRHGADQQRVCAQRARLPPRRGKYPDIRAQVVRLGRTARGTRPPVARGGLATGGVAAS